MRRAIVLDNCVQYIDLVLNIWNKNDSAVLIDYRIPLNRIIEMLKEANVVACYIDSRLYEKGMNICQNTENIEFIPIKIDDDEVVPERVKQSYRPSYSREEAVIFYSSGTTGKSKGIILSHYAITYNAESIIEYMGINHERNIYIAKTFSHSATFVGEILVGLRSGANIYIQHSVSSPSYTLKNIEKYQIHYLCTNPTLLALYIKAKSLLQIKCESLISIYTSGAVLSKDLHDKARESFPGTNINNVYGLSEAGPRVTAQTENNGMPGAVGTPIRGVQIKIVDQNNCEIKKGERGIVLVKTPCRFLGYVSKKSNFSKDDTEWVNTKDVGYLNSNDELVIAGRYDTMMNIASHNVYPEEVENLINRLDGIEDCIVKEIKYKSDENTLACYYIGEKEMSQRIYHTCLDKLAPYETPKIIERVESISYNQNGKKIRW